LNRASASIVVPPLAVSDGRPTLRWLVPSFSGAHSSVADGVQAEAVKREGTEWQMRQAELDMVILFQDISGIQSQDP
jgi:hypothetical protein